MGTMMVTGTAAGTPTLSRRKPRLAVRGRRRAAIRHLLKCAKVVLNQDAKEATRAEDQNYVPFLFTVRGSAPQAKQLLGVIQRCQDTLAAQSQ